MNSESEEIAGSFVTLGGDSIDFFKVFGSVDFPYAESEKSREAWAFVTNLMLGMEKNSSKLSPSDIVAIQNAAVGKFADFGVPSELACLIRTLFHATESAYCRATLLEQERNPALMN